MPKGKIQKSTRGKGITKREVAVLFGEKETISVDDLTAFESILPSDVTFEGLRGKPLQAYMLSVLNNAGFTYERDRMMKDGRRAVQYDGFDEDSEIDFAWRIWNKLQTVRRVVESDNADHVALCAYDLGALFKSAVMKFKWEPDVELAWKFKGDKGPRRDALTKLIDDALGGR